MLSPSKSQIWLPKTTSFHWCPSLVEGLDTDAPVTYFQNMNSVLQAPRHHSTRGIRASGVMHRLNILHDFSETLLKKSVVLV